MKNPPDFYAIALDYFRSNGDNAISGPEGLASLLQDAYDVGQNSEWRVLVNNDGEPYAVDNGSLRRSVDTSGYIEPSFSQIVQNALDDNITALKLADMCEVAPATIIRWAKGTSTPAPGVQKYVRKLLATPSV